MDGKITASVTAASLVFILVSLYKRSNKENLDYIFLSKVSVIGGIVGFSGYHVSQQNFNEPVMTTPFYNNA